MTCPIPPTATRRLDRNRGPRVGVGAAGYGACELTAALQRGREPGASRARGDRPLDYFRVLALRALFTADCSDEMYAPLVSVAPDTTLMLAFCACKTSCFNIGSA